MARKRKLTDINGIPFSQDTMLDAYGSDEETLAKASFDIVAQAAELMVAAALEAAQDAESILKRPGAIVVVDVPAHEWIEPVAAALRTRCFGKDVEVDRNPRRWAWRQYNTAPDVDVTDGWCEIHGSEDPKNVQTDDAVVPIIASGRTVLAISDVPNRKLAKAILRSEDHRIQICSLTSQGFSDLAGKIYNTGSMSMLPDGICRQIGMKELRLAKRPNQTADGFIKRLRSLVESKTADADGISLDDLSGMDEAVEWGKTLAADLKEYGAGQLKWSQVDRGALLHGEPGSGKTTFARALAQSCGVPLISASLYEWQSAGHLGDLQKAMRKSFEQARAAAPSILFIDELDSFGDRERLNGENRHYGIEVINGLLQEIDGIAGREGVIVLGATNFPENIDKAITRAGRLDRLILIPRPNEGALEGILRHHLGDDLADVDLWELASSLLGRNGADVEQIVRGARRRARTAKRPMTAADLEHETRQDQSVVNPVWDKYRSIHEAGHAVAWAILFPGHLTSVSIRETSMSGGTTSAFQPSQPHTRERLKKWIQALLAGRAAEEVLVGDVTAGSGGSLTSDLGLASMLATNMVVGTGLDGNLLVLDTPADAQSDIGRLLLQQPGAINRVRQLLDEEYVVTKNLITRHRECVEEVARQLRIRQTLSGQEVEEIADMGRQGQLQSPHHNKNLPN